MEVLLSRQPQSFIAAQPLLGPNFWLRCIPPQKGCTSGSRRFLIWSCVDPWRHKQCNSLRSMGADISCNDKTRHPRQESGMNPLNSSVPLLCNSSGLGPARIPTQWFIGRSLASDKRHVPGEIGMQVDEVGQGMIPIPRFEV